ncbi:MAG: PorV/PorQ family protein [Flavobacteriales bacterium]|nr:PorV/PorQ family protein [Flavobacteriales bacterium]
MRVKLCFTIVFCVAASVSKAQLLPNFGGQRAGLSTLSFLKNDLNPRSIGMAGASVANDKDGYSSNTNPAAIARMTESGFGLSHLMIGAGIQQSFLSYQHRLKSDAMLGFTLNSLNSGQMQVRTEFQPDGTGQYFSMSQNALTANYSLKLTTMFSLGVGLKYIYETMQTYNNSTAAVDVGFLYQTDFRNLRFAVAVQNFGGSSAIKGETIAVDYNRNNYLVGRYSLPTTFKLGFCIDAYKKDDHLITAAMQLSNPNDNAENIRFGFEYSFKELLSVQTGYKLSVKGQSWPTFGFQYKSKMGVHPLFINYGLNPTNYMGSQHCFGVQLFINKMKRE